MKLAKHGEVFLTVLTNLVGRKLKPNHSQFDAPKAALCSDAITGPPPGIVSQMMMGATLAIIGGLTDP